MLPDRYARRIAIACFDKKEKKVGGRSVSVFYFYEQKESYSAHLLHSSNRRTRRSGPWAPRHFFFAAEKAAYHRFEIGDEGTDAMIISPTLVPLSSPHRMDSDHAVSGNRKPLQN